MDIALTGRERTLLARARLFAQGLLETPGRPSGAAAIVGLLTMVQAQDLGQAFWALGARDPSLRASAVRTAFASGEIVRTWGARGTLMLLRREDVTHLLSVTAPRMEAAAASRRRQLGIAEADVEALMPVAIDRCSGSGATREELFAAFRAAGQPTAGQRGIHLLAALSLRRVLVQGPLREPVHDAGTRRQLFVPFAEWLGPQEVEAAPEEILARLAVRYFSSHGPATDRDFAWWLGLPLGPVRAALAQLGGDTGLAVRSLGGREHLMDARTAAVFDDGPGARSVLALPGWDELLLGYRDRSASLPAEVAERVVPYANGVFKRVIVAGGQVVGTWEAPGGRDGPAVTAHAVGPLFGPARQRAFAARARAYRDFLSG